MTTWRKACTCGSCNNFSRASVRAVCRFQVKLEDGSEEIAVSGLDLLFSDFDDFIKQDTKGRWDEKKFGNMNKGSLWDRVIEELEDTCVSKIERMEKRERTMQTIYRIPVVGYKFLSPPEPIGNRNNALGAYNSLCNEQEKAFPRIRKKIMRNPSKFMFWEGKFYSVGLIYARNGNKFKAVGPTAVSDQSFVGSCGGIREFTKGVTYHSSRRRAGRHQAYRILHRQQDQLPRPHYGQNCTVWKQGAEDDYLEIDLGAPRFVTHIGTAGEYPVLHCFPTHSDIVSQRARNPQASADDGAPVFSLRGNDIHRRKFAPYIYVLKEEESALAWVTSYEVHYRHHLTNKWTLLAVTAANSEALSEAVLDLRPYFNMREGLFTQYLRVRPLTHHLRPVMRVSVYGLDAQSAESTRGAGTANSGVIAQPTATPGEDGVCGADEEGAFIEYAVRESCSHAASRCVRDGLRWFYGQNNRTKYEWNQKERGRTWKKQEVRRIAAALEMDP